VVEGRTEEHRRLLRAHDDRLKGTRWLWLHSENNLTDAQCERFRDIKDAALKTSEARFIKEAFRFFWVVPQMADEAEESFRECYRQTLYSELEPMMKVARMLKERLGNVVAWWRHSITNAVSEGLNSTRSRASSRPCRDSIPSPVTASASSFSAESSTSSPGSPTQFEEEPQKEAPFDLSLPLFCNDA
jgi:transposase